MNFSLLPYIISLIIFFCFSNLTAQDLNSTTNDHRRFAISIGGGQTHGFDRYEISDDHPDIEYQSLRELNLALGFTWYHRNRWFTSLHWHQFNAQTGVRARIDIPATEDLPSSYLSTGNFRTVGFSNYSFRLGRTHFFRNSRWQSRWLAGINLEHIAHDVHYGSLNDSDDRFFSISNNNTPPTQVGIAPSLQAGYQIAYRGKRMGLSLMALGNLGLKYYVLDEYEIWIDNEQYNATTNTKSDLIAWILQYEVYFGNTTSRRLKKEK